MIELKHYYSLTSEWQYNLAKKLQTNLINDKILIFPKKIGHGLIYFSEVVPGVSIALFDVVFTTEVTIKRLKSEDNFYIIQYDLSDEINKIIIKDKNDKTMHNGDSVFTVINNHSESSFTPIVGKRTFTLRMLVDKKTLNSYIKKEKIEAKTNDIGTELLFFKNADSKSQVLIHSITEKSIFDTEFDSYIKGITLIMLANFISSYVSPLKNKITRIERESILRVTEYLLNNLYEKFPSIKFLSQIAGMSTTKFKTVFRKIHNKAPKQFFSEKKLHLAKELLSSQKYSSPTEVVNVLGYNNVEYFNSKYFEYFKKKTSDHFIKKT
ncbi:helix-turn-helix domain-containing protein [Flavobacterium sp. LAR06]|uniref:helix-turn-helix domain-containing protein n=1 Tax=Flavobacterium sp. LAR06 TaxID=3064897 RepID=UPI0035BF45CD